MLRGENITKFEDDGSDDAFDLFGPIEPVIPDQNVTKKLYSIPFEDVSFALEKDHFRITSELQLEKYGKPTKVLNIFKPNPFLGNNIWKCFTGENPNPKPVYTWKIYMTANKMKTARIGISVYTHFPGSMLLSRKHLIFSSSLFDGSVFETEDSPCQANNSILDERAVQDIVSRLGCMLQNLNLALCSPNKLKLYSIILTWT